MASTTSSRVPTEWSEDPEHSPDCAPLAPEIASRGMNPICHRCGATLSASELFCPNCGSPQLKFAQQEEGDSGYPSARPAGKPGRAQGISWKDAILAALIVAVPAGLLSAVSVLSWGCCLWVVGGAVLAIVVYHRRAPAFLLETRSGVRIGAVAGLIAAYSSVDRHRDLARLFPLCSAPGLRHRSVLRFGHQAIDGAGANQPGSPGPVARLRPIPAVTGWQGSLHADECRHHLGRHYSLLRHWRRPGCPPARSPQGTSQRRITPP